jgi:biotin transport system substrate-specific component
MTTAPSFAAAAPARPAALGVRLLAALAGALAVAAAAQVSVPVPGTPVPMTLQPLAVLVVGGLLGPRFGPLAMLSYLALGAAGLPVFTPAPLPPGLGRLFGPTGGYLLAYPLAAAAVGGIGARVRRRYGDRGFGFHVSGTAAAALAGTVIIHAGGWAQLLIITGSLDAALAAGVAPFVVKDVVNVGVAALLIGRFLPSTRALH